MMNISSTLFWNCNGNNQNEKKENLKPAINIFGNISNSSSSIFNLPNQNLNIFNQGSSLF